MQQDNYLGCRIKRWQKGDNVGKTTELQNQPPAVLQTPFTTTSPVCHFQPTTPAHNITRDRKHGRGGKRETTLAKPTSAETDHLRFYKHPSRRRLPFAISSPQRPHTTSQGLQTRPRWQKGDNVGKTTELRNQPPAVLQTPITTTSPVCHG